MVFFISTGRCGTKYLSKTLKGTDHFICHEREHPNVDMAMEKFYLPIALKNEFSLIKKFVEKIKIPQIRKDLQKSNSKVYIDTGHQVNYGIMPYMIERYKNIKLVRLRRDRYETALSFMTKESNFDIWETENYTNYFRWMMDPKFAIINKPIPPVIWNTLNRFQKVLWSIDEIERQWQKLLVTYEFNFFELDFKQIESNNLNALCAFLNVEKIDANSDDDYNSSKKLNRTKPNYSFSQMEKWDQELSNILTNKDN